jgi:nucleoid-associated protein YgaU
MATQSIRYWAGLLACSGMLWGAGCATMGQAQQAEFARRDQELMRIREQLSALSGRIEGMEMEAQRLAREMDQVRRQSEAASQAGVRAMQPQVEDLGRRVAELAAARERDKQAILDDVSRRVAELLRRSGGGSAAPRQATPRRTGPQEGYEHVVQPGETLSAIAQAYGVSTRAILQANNLPNADLLRVGQKLFIPKSP